MVGVTEARGREVWKQATRLSPLPRQHWMWTAVLQNGTHTNSSHLRHASH